MVLDSLDVKDVQDSEGKTALHLSAELGLTGILKILLSRKVNPSLKDSGGRTALHFASMNWNGSDEIVLKLQGYEGLNIMDNKNRKPLYYASANGNLSLVKILLQHTNPAIQDSSGKTALQIAARNGYTEVVQALLKQDRYPLKKPVKQTALYLAAASGHLQIVQALENYGADIWRMDTSKFSKRTVFTMAVHNKDSPLIMYLAERALSMPESRGQLPDGWSTILTNDPVTGQTPLGQAVENNYPNVLGELIKLGADIHEKIASDMTPLLLAVAKGSKNVVRVLMERNIELVWGVPDIPRGYSVLFENTHYKPLIQSLIRKPETAYQDVAEARKIAKAKADPEMLALLDLRGVKRSRDTSISSSSS
jgi:ankyrin repeat protein